MQTAAAAQYLGVSPTKFRDLGIAAKQDGGNVLYDVRDLDAWADGLPYRETADKGQSCEGVFGKTSS
ncbi:hypothetical protein [Yoonia sp. 208BN28-4]|uniref:hypothetical protein n=1 Tax=Yoonia sp. 208BN28-4 TaxID=3126505 RepID=UPI003095C763